MSKPGCPCKSASDVSPDCVYCPRGANVQHGEGNQDYNYGANDQGFGNKDPYGTDGYVNDGYGNDPYGNNASQYSYGRPFSGPNDKDDEFIMSDASWQLLKAAAVFICGCVLTVKMVGVATELG